jgi:cystathionine beta-lyase/cystathionine gamma-synthase
MFIYIPRLNTFPVHDSRTTSSKVQTIVFSPILILTRIVAVTFKHYGINVKFVNDTDPKSFEAAIDEKTKAIYIESIANPKYLMFDIPALAKVGFFLSLSSDDCQ